MGVYYPNSNQTQRYDEKGELIPWVTKYFNGWRAELLEGEEDRFLSWYKNMENECSIFIESCTKFFRYTNPNWNTATKHAYYLREKSLNERGEMIKRLGDPHATSSDVDFWFNEKPSESLIFHLSENWGLTIFEG